MSHKRFVIGDVLGFGWRVMTANFWFFIGLALAAGAIKMLPNIIDNLITELSFFVPVPVLILVNLLTSVIGLFISTIVGIGFIKIALRFCDARKPPFGTLFDFKGCFWRYVGTSILHFLIVMVGSPLFIVPLIVLLVAGGKVSLLPVVLIGFSLFFFLAIFLTIKYGLCQYFVIDKGLGPLQAIKVSGRTTKGAMWQLFGFSILCALIILLGLLCLIVGVLAAYPIVMVANALVYRHLAAQTPELADLQARSRMSRSASIFNLPPPPMASPQG